MSYDYKVTSCSVCKTTVECRSVWSNITPWVCESCCSDEGLYWTQELEEEAEENE